jgi:hypothetical protein
VDIVIGVRFPDHPLTFSIINHIKLFILMETIINIIGKSRFNSIVNNLAKVGKNKVETTKTWLTIGGQIDEFRHMLKAYKAENPTAQVGGIWEMIETAFGIKKSWGCKITKAFALDSEVIEAYFTSRDNNTALTCGIDDLLKFSAQGGESTEGEGEGEGEGGEPKAKPVVTFTCRLEDLGLGSNVSLRINADGSVVTSANAQDIAKAIEILQAALQPVVA